MAKFKEMIKESSDQDFLKKINKAVKLIKQDVGTNNFRGAVVQLKNIVEEYLDN